MARVWPIMSARVRRLVGSPGALPKDTRTSSCRCCQAGVCFFLLLVLGVLVRVWPIMSARVRCLVRLPEALQKDTRTLSWKCFRRSKNARAPTARTKMLEPQLCAQSARKMLEPQLCAKKCAKKARKMLEPQIWAKKCAKNARKKREKCSSPKFG